MTGGTACKCPERQKPVKDRKWSVTSRRWNNSAFVRRGGERSDYSTVWCHHCNTAWRTKARFVADLPDNREFKEYGDNE